MEKSGFGARNAEDPPLDRKTMNHWAEIFQVPTPEEMAFFDTPLISEVSSVQD
jgi:hypothetical protein